MPSNKQVKSKERVVQHSEVFTNDREVNAMLDLVKQETERIESRFLEPACGDGNFLAEILRRKLEVVTKMYKKNPYIGIWLFSMNTTMVHGVKMLETYLQWMMKKKNSISRNMQRKKLETPIMKASCLLQRIITCSYQELHLER